jgi:hypothetical protein
MAAASRPKYHSVEGEIGDIGTGLEIHEIASGTGDALTTS